MNGQEQALYNDIQQDLAWFSRNVIDPDMRRQRPISHPAECCCNLCDLNDCEPFDPTVPGFDGGINYSREADTCDYGDSGYW